MDINTMLIIFGLLIITVLLGLIVFLQMRKPKASTDNQSEIIFSLMENMRKELGETKHQLSESLTKNSNSLNTQMNQTLGLLQKEFGDVRKTVDSKLDSNTKNINERLDNAAKAVANVSTELGKVQEMGDSMKSLQDFLRAPKLRGNIGEQILKDLLEQKIPKDLFQMQYKFNSGETVDAVLKTSDGLICIDSKFPLENFRKMINAEDKKEKEEAQRTFRADVKKHIKDIEKKYILPAENTKDFAMMYVPAESIFYEIAVKDEELMRYAAEHRIHPVSPNTLLYYLQAVMLAFSGRQIDENVKKVIDAIKDIKNQSAKFGEEVSVLSRHITNAKSKMDDVNLGYEKLNAKIGTATEIKGAGDLKALGE